MFESDMRGSFNSFLPTAAGYGAALTVFQVCGLRFGMELPCVVAEYHSHVVRRLPSCLSDRAGQAAAQSIRGK